MQTPDATNVSRNDNSSFVLARLREMIDAGQTASDGRLPTERDLCERLSVGRRAVRRALEALEAEGLLWRRQGKGTFIGQPPDPTGALAAEIAADSDPFAVMEARLTIEPALARLAADRALPDDIDRMRHLAARAVSTLDPDGAELWDGSLHRLIARTAGNRLLLTAFGLIDAVRSGKTWQDIRQQARSAEAVAHYDSQHGAIIDAIAARDGAAADAAMRAHIASLSDNLARVLRRTDAA